MNGFTVADTKSYYDSMTLDSATQIAREMIDEWDYETDPHGYCHLRPVLLRLVEAVRRLGVDSNEETT